MDELADLCCCEAVVSDFIRNVLPVGFAVLARRRLLAKVAAGHLFQNGDHGDHF